MRVVRVVAPAATLASGFLLAGTLYVSGYHVQYHILLRLWGALPFETPFLDMHAITSAIECHRRGFDVYVQNPCDVFQRPHGYSPVWLWLAAVPISTAWDNALGLTLDLLFLVSVLFLPPGRGAWQTTAITFGAISSVVAYALERSNADLLIFILATISARLNQRCTALRLGGYAVAFLAGSLKFYPIALLVLAVRERLGVFFSIGFIALAAIALWFTLAGAEILRGMANIPTTSYFDDNIFGARDLPFGLAQILGLERHASLALLLLLLIMMVGCAVLLASRNILASKITSLTEAETGCLLAGCVLIIGSFLAAQNSLYRAIFLLFVLPGVTALAGSSVLVGPIVVLMWTSGIYALINVLVGWSGIPLPRDGTAYIAIWLSRELLWWSVITMLLALMLRVIWESRAWKDATRMVALWR